MPSAMVIPRGWVALPLIHKAALGHEIISTYLRMRLILRRGDVTSTVRQLRDRSGLQPPGQDEICPDTLLTGMRLGHAVGRTLRLLPSDSRCLMRSLVLLRILARRGLASSLVIGVSPAPEFKAHAWIELAGEPVLPAGSGNYARLVEL
jgi:hypothetical protein